MTFLELAVNSKSENSLSFQRGIDVKWIQCRSKNAITRKSGSITKGPKIVALCDKGQFGVGSESFRKDWESFRKLSNLSDKVGKIGNKRKFSFLRHLMPDVNFFRTRSCGASKCGVLMALTMLKIFSDVGSVV